MQYPLSRYNGDFTHTQSGVADTGFTIAMDSHTNKEDRQSVLNIFDLARRMDHSQQGSDTNVVFFVGAGASMPSGLPSGKELAKIIHNDFVGPSEGLSNFLETEIGASFKKKKYSELSLFELCSVVSSSVYGQNSMHQSVTTSLGQARNRPLGLELIAHLAKHKFVRNIVCLNFDTLLDESFIDEAPERTEFVFSEQDVPLEPDKEVCYLVKPFGSIGEGQYSLSLEDVNNFGPPAVRKFIERYVMADGHLIIVLIGYRGAEASFHQLVRDHNGSIELFVIDPDHYLLRELRANISEKIPINQIIMIGDEALDILMEVLSNDVQDAESWIPPARHRIISRCKHEVTSMGTLGNDQRFCLELLLQAVKSRGFVHLESFSKVPRLHRYGTRETAKVIQTLVEENILVADEWLTCKGSELPGKMFVPNYALTPNLEILGCWIANKFCMENDVKTYTVGKPNIGVEKKPIAKYIYDQLVNIENATDIEIFSSESKEARWNLGPDCQALSSPRELFLKTRGALEKFGDGGTLRGIWSTGEWLFHDQGWASQLRDSFIRGSNVQVKAIITDRGGIYMRKSERRNTIIDWMEGQENIDMRYLDWWELNRVLSIFQPEGRSHGAIYFRRRLNQPIVQPFWVPMGVGKEKKNNHSGLYIEELWDRYWERARLKPFEAGER